MSYDELIAYALGQVDRLIDRPEIQSLDSIG